MRSDEATHLEAVDLSTLTMGRPIGKGGFATIWFARWQGNDLAIKVFNVAARAGLSCTKLAMLRRLRHPSICALFGHMWVDEWPALVLEYMVGGSLAAYLFHPRPAFCNVVPPRNSSRSPASTCGLFASLGKNLGNTYGVDMVVVMGSSAVFVCIALSTHMTELVDG